MWVLFLVLLNKYETACLIIHGFCKSCECFCFDMHSCRTISCLQVLQNAWINIVVIWKFWKKYWPVSYLFDCINRSFHCFHRNEHHYAVFNSDFCSLTVQTRHACHTGSSACLLVFASHSLKSHYTHTFPLIKLSIHRYVAKLCNANIPRISM